MRRSSSCRALAAAGPSPRVEAHASALGRATALAAWGWMMRTTSVWDVPGHDSYRAAVEATFPDLQRWKERAAKTPSERPERGSQLEADDRVFTHFPISEAARLSLVASGEHLRLAADAVRAEQPYPSAHFTVLRGALVGAAQAVWVLSPDDGALRLERGLTVVAETYAQTSIFYNDLTKFTLSAEDRTRLTSQQEWLKERRDQVAALRTGSAKLDLTNIVIPNALDHTFSSTERREHGRQLWRQMSADAHVLGWSMFQRASFGGSDRRTGLSDGRVTGSWADIAQPFVACHLMLKEGWSLFDRRCEGR